LKVEKHLTKLATAAGELGDSRQSLWQEPSAFWQLLRLSSCFVHVFLKEFLAENASFWCQSDRFWVILSPFEVYPSI